MLAILFLQSFFGRASNNFASFGECKFNGNCVINKKTRTLCKTCRLKKCLHVGMSKSGSRYGRRSNWFKINYLMQDSDDKDNAANDKTKWTQNQDGATKNELEKTKNSKKRQYSYIDIVHDGVNLNETKKKFCTDKEVLHKEPNIIKQCTKHRSSKSKIKPHDLPIYANNFNIFEHCNNVIASPLLPRVPTNDFAICDNPPAQASLLLNPFSYSLPVNYSGSCLASTQRELPTPLLMTHYNILSTLAHSPTLYDNYLSNLRNSTTLTQQQNFIPNINRNPTCFLDCYNFPALSDRALLRHYSVTPRALSTENPKAVGDVYKDYPLEESINIKQNDAERLQKATSATQFSAFKVICNQTPGNEMTSDSCIDKNEDSCFDRKDGFKMKTTLTDHTPIDLSSSRNKSPCSAAPNST